jgi:hypothetical protein
MYRCLAVLLSGWLLCSCVVSDWDERESRRASLSKVEPSQNEELLEADISLPVGTLEIEAGTSANLYEIDLEYNERSFRPDIDFRRSGAKAELRFRLSGEGRSSRKVGKNRLTLRLNPNVALVLRTRTGVGESQIDLGGMSVRELDLENGVGETALTMLSPNRITCDEVQIRNGVGALDMTGLGNLGFQRLRFQGGVGGSNLDFSGDWKEEADVEVEVGVGGVKLRLPRSVGAEVRAGRSFLSGVDLPEFEKRGDKYYSYNLSRVSKVVRFRVQAGIGGVEWDWL